MSGRCLRTPLRRVSGDTPPSPREALLAAASRAVLAAFRDPLEQRTLSAPATAALRLLESAVEPYFRQD